MTERRAASDDEARALSSSLRLRILRVCLGEARTNKEIAAALGRDPATTLHHVRRLVRAGFLEAQPERRGTRGAREVPYLSTGKSWQLDSPVTSKVLLEAFLEDVGSVSAADVRTGRLGLRLSEPDLEEFTGRLVALLDEYAARPEDPSGTPWSVFFAVHPDPTRP